MIHKAKAISAFQLSIDSNEAIHGCDGPSFPTKG